MPRPGGLPDVELEHLRVPDEEHRGDHRRPRALDERLQEFFRITSSGAVSPAMTQGRRKSHNIALPVLVANRTKSCTIFNTT
jgi:hypothetical protein